MESNVGLRLKQMRLEFGFTQKQIAQYLGFKQSQVAKLENNERKLKHSSMIKLCDLYNCSHNYILYGEGDYSKPDLAFRGQKNEMNLATLAEMNVIIRNLNHLSQLNGDGK